jgi:hypothetical protein
MDPIEKMERKREAQHRLRLQRQKVGELRGRVIAISLCCFALLWGVVCVQMATGNDPVLGDRSGTISQRNGSGNHRHKPRASAVEGSAATDSVEAPPGAETGETGEPEAAEPAVEPVGEEFSETEPEPEFVEPEPEPAPVTTSQS